MLPLLFIGLMVGLASSFFGIGGGAIIVPGLYFLYPQIPPQTVIACSLGVIFFNGLINTRHFWKLKQRPHFGVVIPLAAAMALGAPLGSFWAMSLPPLLLKKIFAVLLFLMALRLSFSRPAKSSTPSVPSTSPPLLIKGRVAPRKVLKTLLVGLMAGIIAGLTGLGGGIIIVPTLIFLYQLPFSQVASYSNPAMALCALSGILTFLSGDPPNLAPTSLPEVFHGSQWGQFNLMIVFLLIASSWVSSYWGAKWATKTPPHKAKKVFTLLFYALSLLIFLS